MLTLITGTPGAGKTQYAVSLIFDYEVENKKHIKENPSIYRDNLKIINDLQLNDKFNQVTDLKDNIIELPSDYFDDLANPERTTAYFEKSSHYNSIIKLIVEDNPSLKLKPIKPVRTIYADINGLRVDNVLKSPDDWRTTPNGSIVFYDEIQQRKEYKDQKGQQPIVSALQVHRHTGHDIYGITQFPVLLHTHFRSVVGQHLHLHRGWGLFAATVYLWAYCVLTPNSTTNKRIAERDFRFRFKKKYQDAYKSAYAHTHKLRIPPKFLFLFLIPIIGLYLTYHNLFASDNFISNVATGYKDKDTKKQEVKNPLNPTASTTDKTKPQVQAQTQPQASQIFTYDANKPFDVDYSTIQRQPTNLPQFAGCIMIPKGCTCYSQQGTKLDVSLLDCKRVIGGDMPFNAFRQPEQPVIEHQLEMAQTSAIDQPQQQSKPVVIGQSTINKSEIDKQRDDAWSNASPYLNSQKAPTSRQS